MLPLLWAAISTAAPDEIAASLPIHDQEGVSIGVVHVKNGEQAADVAHHFCTQHKLPDWFYEAIVQQLCANPADGVLCTRDKQNPLLSSRTIRKKGRELGTLEFFLQELPSATVTRFCHTHTLPSSYCQKLLAAVCSSDSLKAHCEAAAGGTPGVPGERHQAHGVVLFATPIATQNGTILGDLEISGGQEPADVVLDFCVAHMQPDDFCHAMIEQVCRAISEEYPDKRLSCTRPHALLFSREITQEDGSYVAELEVPFLPDPSGAVLAWCEEHALSPAFCNALLRSVCASIDADYPPAGGAASRCADAGAGGGGAVLYENAIERDGRRLGTVRVRAGEQVWDVVHAFCRAGGIADPSFEHAMARQLCALPALAAAGCCDRPYVVLYSTMIDTDAGNQRFELRVGEEPADAVHRFCTAQTPPFAEAYCQQMLAAVCAEVQARNLANCTRAVALVFAQPLTGAGGGDQGTIQVFTGQQPTDRVYQYCKTKEMLPTHAKVMASMCPGAPPPPPALAAEIRALLDSANVTAEIPTRGAGHLDCRRLKPREVLVTVDVGFGGLNHRIEYVRPFADDYSAATQPDNEWYCFTVHGGRGTECQKWTTTFAAEWCDTYIHGWAECPKQIEDAIEQRLEAFEKRRWGNSYKILGLEHNCDQIDIEHAYRRLSKKYTKEFDARKHAKIQVAYAELSNPKKRQYEDQPCVPIFGSLCGKRSADGGLRVIMPSAGDDFL